MRLIDADALRAHMYHEAFETDTDMQRWDSGCWIRYKMFENALDNAPTIEPQRMRGRWIPTEPDEPCFYQCSICRRLNDVTDNFCPNCGAWMGGQDDRNDGGRQARRGAWSI